MKSHNTHRGDNRGYIGKQKEALFEPPMKYTITSRTRTRGRVGIHRSPIGSIYRAPSMGSASLRVTKGAGSTGGVRRGSLTLKAGSSVPSQIAQVGRNGMPESSARSVSSELREPRSPPARCANFAHILEATRFTRVRNAGRTK